TPRRPRSTSGHKRQTFLDTDIDEWEPGDSEQCRRGWFSWREWTHKRHRVCGRDIDIDTVPVCARRWHGHTPWWVRKHCFGDPTPPPFNYGSGYFGGGPGGIWVIPVPVIWKNTTPITWGGGTKLATGNGTWPGKSSWPVIAKPWKGSGPKAAPTSGSTISLIK